MHFTGIYDTVILDVDNKNPSLGISSPPISFLESSVLINMRQLINDSGTFYSLDFSFSDSVFSSVMSLLIKTCFKKVYVCTSIN